MINLGESQSRNFRGPHAHTPCAEFWILYQIVPGNSSIFPFVPEHTLSELCHSLGLVVNTGFHLLCLYYVASIGLSSPQILWNFKNHKIPVWSLLSLFY